MKGDWYFAPVAGNAGPGNVNKAIRRSGGKTTTGGSSVLPVPPVLTVAVVT